MKVKLKNICVDINKPKSIDKLRQLKTVCEDELKICTEIKKGFILFILQMVNKKLKTLTLNSSVNKEVVKINSY
mgnify:CR=1 FL=1|tara:strand:+ start:2124 stop:2345 length:222 start_codon:yes stop_codon:yes gene_type:complete